MRGRRGMVRGVRRAPWLLLVAGLVAGGVSACGGDASVEDFCASYETLQSAGDEEDSTTAEISAVQDALSGLEDVGTPEGMPQDAHDGLDVLGDVVGSIDEDASEADLDQIDENVGAADQDKVEAFFVYAAQTCEPGAEQ